VQERARRRIRDSGERARGRVTQSESAWESDTERVRGRARKRGCEEVWRCASAKESEGGGGARLSEGE